MFLIGRNKNKKWISVDLKGELTSNTEKERFSRKKIWTIYEIENPTNKIILRTSTKYYEVLECTVPIKFIDEL